LSDLLNYYDYLGFTIDEDRSIHHPKNILFAESVLNFPVWHLNLLKNGLSFDWKSGAPPSYCEPNNKSAVQHLPQLRDKVAEWHRDGFIYKVSSRPFCCNPMTVAVQHNIVTNSVKYRPCIDLSRHVNNFISPIPCKLDDLSAAQELIAAGDFMTSLDLENQFFQVQLDPAMCKFLGFMVPEEDGTPAYYIFKVMPYGVIVAVAIVTRLLLPVKAFFHRLGIKFSVYVDDGRISAATSALCSAHHRFVLSVLQRLGWRIQWKKTVSDPTTSLLHLGFVTDSVQMTYSLPAEKWDKFVSSVQVLLDLTRRSLPVPARDLAAVLGRLNSMSRSHGSVTRVLSRSLQHHLGIHVNSQGWAGHIYLDSDDVAELLFQLLHLPSFNHRFIPTVYALSTVLPLSQVADQVAAVAGSDCDVPNLLVSDASATGSFIYLADGSFSLVSDAPVGPGSSTARELDALLNFLQQSGASFLAGGTRIIYWQTDSKSAAHIAAHGSRHRHLQLRAFHLKCLERSFNFQVIPVWTPRLHTRILLADLGSRLSHSTDEWSLCREAIAQIFVTLNIFPQVDAFAVAANAIFPTFFSCVPQPGSAGVDFFAQDLDTTLVYFFCPPISLISRLLRLLFSTPSLKFVLIIPDWPSKSFWSVAHPHGVPHPIFTAATVCVPQIFSVYGTRTVFSGGNTRFLAFGCS